jgi:tetratricopeptide (TPR) repeat protein
MNQNLKQLFEKLGRANQLVEDYRRAKEGSADHALAHVNWGIELAEKGELEEALEKFRVASEIAPTRYEPFFNWGVALARNKQNEEALEKLQLSIERNPKSSGAHILQGALLVELKRYDEAKEKYEKASALSPGSSEPFANWGTALARQGEYQEAIVRFRQSLSLQGNQPQLFFLWGTVLAEMKDFDGAIEKFRLTLRFNPKHANAYHFWSICLNQMGRFQEALEKSETSLKNDASNAQAHLNQGDILTNLIRLEEALIHYEKAIELEPTLAEAYLGWAVALSRLKRFAEAEEKFTRCLAINMNLPELHNQWGRFLMDQGRNEEALIHFQSGIALEPQNVAALLNLALVQLKLNQRKEALSTLIEVEELDRWNPQAQYLLGTHYLGEGHYDKALKHLSNALEEKPDFEEAAVNLALALCEKGDTLEAIRRLRPILRRLPDSAHINFYYGLILERHGDWQDAIVKYRKSMDIKPDYPEPAIGLAELYLRQGMLEDGDNTLKSLLKEESNYIPALFLQGVCRIRLADSTNSPDKKRLYDAQAQQNFEKILTLDSNHLEAQVNLALMHGRRQSTEHMNQSFELLVENTPAHQKALLLYYWSQALTQQGETQQAEQKMQEAIQENPQIAQMTDSL